VNATTTYYRTTPRLLRLRIVFPQRAGHDLPPTLRTSILGPLAFPPVTMNGNGNGNHHVVRGVDELLRIHLKLREIIELGQPRADAVVSAMHRRAEIVLAVPPSSISVRSLSQGSSQSAHPAFKASRTIRET
jgi:hypothetical protein